MFGVRVLHLPQKIEVKRLKIHFRKPEHGGGEITKIHYPLLNNDAVILFNDPLVVDTVMECDHDLGGKRVELVRLPDHQVFSKVETRLDATVSSFLQATQKVLDELIYDAEIEVSFNQEGIATLQGNWFQLEYAWHFLNQFMNQQEVIATKLAQSKSTDVPMEFDDDEGEATQGQYYQRASDKVQVKKRSTSTVSATVSRPPYTWDDGPDERDQRTPEKFKTEQSSAFSQEIIDVGRQGSSGTGLSARERRRNRNEVGRGMEDFQRLYDYDQYAPSPADDSPVSTPPRRQLDQDVLRSHHESPSPSSSGRHKSYGTIDSDQTYCKSIGGPQSQDSYDDDLDLVGQGHNIPLESVHSTIYQASPRTSDANATFEKFSSIHINRSSPGSDSRISDSPVGREDTPPVGRDGTTPVGRDGTPTGTDGASNVADQNSGSSHYQPGMYSDDMMCCEFQIEQLKVVVYRGDICREECDAIVNAAMGSLINAGGVARAISKTADPKLQSECDEYVQRCGELKTGQVMHTCAGGMLNRKVMHVLHTVGPVWIAGFGKEKCAYQLTKTFLNCCKYADEKMWLKSLAMPVISSGIFGVPLEICVHSFLHALLIFCSQRKHPLNLREVHLVNNDPESTVTSIIMLQSLMEAGLDKITAEALELYNKYNDTDDYTRGSKTFTVNKDGRESWSASLYGEGATREKTHVRRSSSLSRISDRKPKYEETDRKTENFSSSTLDRRTGKYSSLTLTGTSFGQRAETKPGAKFEKVASRTDSGLRRPTSASLSQSKGGSLPGRSLTSKVTSSSMSQSSRGVTTKRPSTAERLKQTGPPVKQTLLADDSLNTSRIKSSIVQKSGSRRLPLKATPAPDRYSSPRESSTDQSGSDGEFVPMQSLPADWTPGNYREKFLDEISSPKSLDLRHTTKDPETCSICLETMTSAKTLPKCKHTFCRPCIDEYFKHGKPQCPSCGMVYGVIKGDQPHGTMTFQIEPTLRIPGYEYCDGAIVISYSIPSGRQESHHPSPGEYYYGITRKAYLPNNTEGQEVLRLLKRAFDARLIFTIGESRTTGAEGVVTWNDIHHKTSASGGPTMFGYPDRTYLQRVKEELAARGITSDT